MGPPGSVGGGFVTEATGIKRIDESFSGSFRGGVFIWIGFGLSAVVAVRRGDAAHHASAVKGVVFVVEHA